MEKTNTGNSFYNKHVLRNNNKNQQQQKSTLDEFNDILKSVKCLHMSSGRKQQQDLDDEQVPPSFDEECFPLSASNTPVSTLTSPPDSSPPPPPYDSLPTCHQQYHSAPERKIATPMSTRKVESVSNTPSQTYSTSMKYFGLPSIRQLFGSRQQRRNNRIHDSANGPESTGDCSPNVRVMVGIDEDLEMILDMDPTIVDMGVQPDEGPKICGLPPINGG
jgi:hypothetical protein